uniref:DUF834 domain-containing protein n=1 Tax=Oryza meridionalis TaxID=40149 RepID=A0A0E0EQ95_9ORYZ
MARVAARGGRSLLESGDGSALRGESGRERGEYGKIREMDEGRMGSAREREIVAERGGIGRQPAVDIGWRRGARGRSNRCDFWGKVGENEEWVATTSARSDVRARGRRRRFWRRRGAAWQLPAGG